MQSRFLSATATAVLLSVFGAWRASADDRMPFDPRVAHTYESQGPITTTSFSTYFRQRSTDLWELHFLGGEDDGLVQLWAENAEHDKYLHEKP